MKSMTKILLALTLISTAAMATDGAGLYKKCASCHGSSGEKKALGKSKVINEMTQVNLVSALKGYQDGSYGASMKALMKGQVAKLNNEDIDALAQYISTMKK